MKHADGLPDQAVAKGSSPEDKSSHVLRRNLVQAMGGPPPISVINMVADWALHFATAPDKQVSLVQEAQASWWKWAGFVAAGCPDSPEERPIAPQRNDHRFLRDGWKQAPFAAYEQAFLLTEDFVDRATTNVPGLTPAHDRSMTFLARQMMDMFAPSNFLLANPEALARTYEEGGRNLIRGYQNALAQWLASYRQEAPKMAPRVGGELGVSRGKVVLRTHLMELIQYEPATKQVYSEPVLLVPAWIMKYYILDLSADNSLVRYLTDQGFTVFMISWRNPGAEDAHLGMADYLQQGPRAAIDHICRETGTAKVHGVGYCLGGTLLSIAAASMARDDDDRLASMTLLAAQTDFSEAGELMLFINESQVSFLEEVMANQGFLAGKQMMSAFQMMRSNDLIWSRVIRSFLLGMADAPMNDLMAWNADTTRMPARMHSEYLRQMFLNNDLAAGRYRVDGHAVSLRDIKLPVFAVGTETDHIAPWKSVFKIHALSHADVSFVLTNGGHNAGVISEPGHKGRRYRLHTIRDQDRALTPEDWLDAASLEPGSWWPAWARWLANNSTGRVDPPPMTGDLCPAPGTYVMME